ncbi:hypothetical protein L1049_016972 [Liquidambar formosana]|uniref:Ubiquitin-like protease family profile domain-containing protein n=1 Tax=Liquidambar formosana TaxID=63359 RepID=A0AAP0S078_LIQFO
MGALTSNRKRGDDYFSSNRTIPSLYSPDWDPRIDNPVSKKPRVSSMHQSPDRTVLSRSTVSRICRYPEAAPPLRREVQAPCRNRRFGFSTRSSSDWRFDTGGVSEKEEKGDFMGNVLTHHYDRAKSCAMGALRYFTKDKEVIDVDAEVEYDEVSEDSSVEEIEAFEDLREGLSAVSDQRSRENNGVVADVQELDAKNVKQHRPQHPSYSSAVSDLTNGHLRVENVGKMIDELSLNRGADVDRVPVHKKLLKSVERLTPRLSSLRFQIDYLEKHRSSFRLFQPVKKPEKNVPREPFVPLTKEEEADVSRAFAANRRKVLVTHENSNIEITGEKLLCLRPGAWLNDEVINLYLELLKEREKREPKKFLKCHFFNTFFYKKLIGGRSGYDFKSVRRWTTQRKLGYSLIECDKIFVPIHKEVHWCLAVINKKEEKFQYLDSLRGTDSQVLKVLARYFMDEVKDKNGNDIDVSSWKQEFVEDLPEQENGWDCGVFMIKYADFYSRGVGLCFNQVRNIKYNALAEELCMYLCLYSLLCLRYFSCFN